MLDIKLPGLFEARTLLQTAVAASGARWDEFGEEHVPELAFTLFCAVYECRAPILVHHLVAPEDLAPFVTLVRDVFALRALLERPQVIEETFQLRRAMRRPEGSGEAG